MIFNAVNDALQGLGVELTETPLTPRRLLEAIEHARPPHAPGRRMKAARFDYLRPGDVAEAVAALAKAAGSAKLWPAANRSDRC